MILYLWRGYKGVQISDIVRRWTFTQSKFATGQLVSVNARKHNYSLSEDDYLFREFRTWFGGYKLEYISPGNVFTGYAEHNNIYRNYTREQKAAILNKMDNEKLPYELNRTHLHHLHLALNPNRGAKEGKVLKVVLTVIAGFIWLETIRG